MLIQYFFHCFELLYTLLEIVPALIIILCLLKNYEHYTIPYLSDFIMTIIFKMYNYDNSGVLIIISSPMMHGHIIYTYMYRFSSWVQSLQSTCVLNGMNHLQKNDNSSWSSVDWFSCVWTSYEIHSTLPLLERQKLIKLSK